MSQKDDGGSQVKHSRGNFLGSVPSGPRCGDSYATTRTRVRLSIDGESAAARGHLGSEFWCEWNGVVRSSRCHSGSLVAHRGGRCRRRGRQSAVSGGRRRIVVRGGFDEFGFMRRSAGLSAPGFLSFRTFSKELLDFGTIGVGWK
jgi:hypothetical protein